MSVVLGRIVVFPIKALDGVEVSHARVTPGGVLEHDRGYAIVDADGRAVNGKRQARVHRLRARFDPSFREVWFAEQGSERGAAFILAKPDPIGRWLSEFFGFPVSLKGEPRSGFPDDREAFGPTLVGKASLETVAGWYPGLGLDSARRRFRANLEIDGAGMPPFWEDRLYGGAGERKPFRIGEVEFLAHNPCQRCVVPTRDPDTGEPIQGFQQEFMRRRAETLPPWANAGRFNHFYRFAVNTSVPPAEAGKTLGVGDAVAWG